MTLLARIKSWAVYLLIGLALVGGAFLSGRSKGKSQAQAKADAAAAELQIAEQREVIVAVEQRHQVEDVVERMPADAVREELRNNWTRR